MSPEPIVTVTHYRVSCLPREHAGWSLFSVSVEQRGPERWAVVHFSQCYDIDGNASYEPSSSERTDEWLARYSHDRVTALEIAKRLAPTLEVNGHTVESVLARKAAQ